MAHAGGRPPKYTDPAVMQAGIDEYFTLNPDRPTLSGLALFLGFMDRDSMYKYVSQNKGANETVRKEFIYVIKSAIARIAQSHEERMYGNTPAGSIFVLKNMGWSDKQEHTGEGGGPIIYQKVGELTDEQLAIIAAKDITRSNTGKSGKRASAPKSGKKSAD